MNEYKYNIPVIPEELAQPQNEREQAYLQHIQSLTNMLRKDFATGLEHREEFLSATEGRQGVVIYIDGDNLKMINDVAQSHDVGDAAIKAIAKAISNTMEDAIKSVIRSSERANVARMGGDEFAIFLPGVSSLETGVVVANRILEAIRKETITHSKLGEHQLTASVGVGFSRDEADKAMYQAKVKGRNRVETYSEDNKVEHLARIKYKMAKQLYDRKYYKLALKLLSS